MLCLELREEKGEEEKCSKEKKIRRKVRFFCLILRRNGEEIDKETNVRTRSEIGQNNQ